MKGNAEKLRTLALIALLLSVILAVILLIILLAAGTQVGTFLVMLLVTGVQVFFAYVLFSALHALADAAENSYAILDRLRRLEDALSPEGGDKPRPHPAPAARDAGEWVCKQCKTENAANTRFCSGCGAYR